MSSQLFYISRAVDELITEAARKLHSFTAQLSLLQDLLKLRAELVLGALEELQDLLIVLDRFDLTVMLDLVIDPSSEILQAQLMRLAEHLHESSCELRLFGV